MRIIYKLFFVIILVSSLYSADPGITGWHYVSSSLTCEVTTNQAHSGDYSVTMYQPTSSSYKYMFQTNIHVSNVTLNAEGYVKGTNMTDAFLRLGAATNEFYWSSYKTYVDSNSLTSDSDTWYKLTISGFTVPQGCNTIKLGLYFKYSSGDTSVVTYWDDIKVWVTTNTNNLIQNGDFEPASSGGSTSQTPSEGSAGVTLFSGDLDNDLIGDWWEIYYFINTNEIKATYIITKVSNNITTIITNVYYLTNEFIEKLLNIDPFADPDNDGFTTLEEARWGSSPINQTGTNTNIFYNSINHPDFFTNIVFNEFMFDPPGSGDIGFFDFSVIRVDYIELYNRMTTSITLNGWSIEKLTYDTTGNVTISTLETFDATAYLEPHGYLVISRTPTTNSWDETYSFSNINVLTSDEIKLSSYGKEYIFLIDNYGNIMDRMYIDTLLGGKNRSLEKINPNISSYYRENWGSTISTFNGTPGRINSLTTNQITDLVNKNYSKPIPYATPQVFSPNRDGYNDTTSIKFELATEETGTLEIYSVNGELLKSFYQRLSGPVDKFVIWDGRTDDGSILPVGFYIVNLKVVKDGAQKDYRSPVVISGNLNSIHR